MALGLLASAAEIHGFTADGLRAPLSGLTVATAATALVALGVVGRSVWALGIGAVALAWWPLLEAATTREVRPIPGGRSCDPGCISTSDWLVFLAILGLVLTALGWAPRALTARVAGWRRAKAASA